MNKYSVRFLLTFIALLLFMVFTIGKATCQVPSPVEIKNDGRALTVGIVFQPDSPSIVTGLRVYRPWTGEVTGQLYTQTGRLVATTSLPPSDGWQIGYFLQPVKISPDSAYIATYFSASGNYGYQEYYFPASFSNWEGLDSRYAYFTSPLFPEATYNRTNYGIEPIIAVEQPTAPGQTVVIFRDTCTLDYSKLEGLSLSLILPDEGGPFLLPDSITAYQALYGAAPPHQRLKNDTSLIADRFFRGTGEARRRITLYRTGAWIRERLVNGKWEVVQ